MRNTTKEYVKSQVGDCPKIANSINKVITDAVFPEDLVNYIESIASTSSAIIVDDSDPKHIKLTFNGNDNPAITIEGNIVSWVNPTTALVNQVPIDWNEQNASNLSYIAHKPQGVPAMVNTSLDVNATRNTITLYRQNSITGLAITSILLHLVGATLQNAGLMTAADKTKLDNLNPNVLNYHSDWNLNNPENPSYIYNKPTIPNIAKLNGRELLNTESTIGFGNMYDIDITPKYLYGDIVGITTDIDGRKLFLEIINDYSTKSSASVFCSDTRDNLFTFGDYDSTKNITTYTWNVDFNNRAFYISVYLGLPIVRSSNNVVLKRLTWINLDLITQDDYIRVEDISSIIRQPAFKYQYTINTGSKDYVSRIDKAGNENYEDYSQAISKTVCSSNDDQNRVEVLHTSYLFNIKTYQQGYLNASSDFTYQNGDVTLTTMNPLTGDVTGSWSIKDQNPNLLYVNDESIGNNILLRIPGNVKYNMQIDCYISGGLYAVLIIDSTWDQLSQSYICQYTNIQYDGIQVHLIKPFDESNKYYWGRYYKFTNAYQTVNFINVHPIVQAITGTYEDKGIWKELTVSILPNTTTSVLNLALCTIDISNGLYLGTESIAIPVEVLSNGTPHSVGAVLDVDKAIINFILKDSGTVNLFNNERTTFKFIIT